MSNSNDNLFRNLQSFTFGRSHKSSDNGNLISNVSTGYTFLTGLVIDVVSTNGSDFLKKNIQKNKAYSETIKNYHFLNKLTPNSLIVKILDNANSLIEDSFYVALPFFSPHISIPIKPGEYVWLLKELDIGLSSFYWISRKHGIDQVDDVNYTFLERSNTIENKIELKNKEKNLGIKKSSFIEDPTKEENEIAEMHSYLPGQLPDYSVNGTKFVNRQIVDNSIDFKNRFAYDVVPKISKNPGDTLLQGSNNTLIHLTTEKFKNGLHENVLKNEPAIDICIGRKKRELSNLFTDADLINPLKKVFKTSEQNSSISAVKSLTADGEDQIFEINKVNSLYEDIDNTADYFDQDPLNCGARIYMSNNCDIDSIFKTNFDVLSSHAGESIAIFSNINRIIGQHSTRIANLSGESFLDMDSSGNIVIKASKDNGQQFLSLINNGVSRLQAKNKIQLAVGTDNDSESNSVTEPYILHSELAPLLKKLAGDVAFSNLILDTLLEALSYLPPIAPIAQVVKQGRAIRELGDNLNQSIPFEVEPQFDESGNEISAGFTGSLSLEALGGNITQDNIFEDAIDVIDNKIKSTKIFGEENDPEI